MSAVLKQLAAQRVVPVLRNVDADDALRTARACARAGAAVIELTCSTPGVEGVLRQLQADGLTVGLGTITEADEVVGAAAAGASFVVSFGHPPGFLPAADRCGVVPIPGVLTPTEALSATAAGAPAVKLFPARGLHPDYLRDLRTVMPDLQVMVTGGVTVATAAQWLESGALVVGIGAELGSAASDGEDVVEHRTREALQRFTG